MSINYPRMMQAALRLLAVCGILALPISATASPAADSTVTTPSDGGGAGDAGMRWEVSLTYASGIRKVMDQMETTFGVSKDFEWPFGLKFGGYDEFASGWCLGGSVGPCEVIAVKEFTDTNYNYIVPVTIDVRYIFRGQGREKVYVRAGLTQALAGGDYIGSGTLGPAVAIGAEIWHGSSMSFGMETGYDGSKIKVKDNTIDGMSFAGSYTVPGAKVTPVGFNVSFFVRF